jgi:tetratricopeptide (TPR) repeat protein
MRCKYGLAFVTVAVALGGCAGQAPQSETDYRRDQVLRSHQRGADAVVRGEYGRALYYYENALDQARSLEDADAVAVNLLNIAAVLHRSGEFAAARARLLQLIEHVPPLPEAYVGRAEGRLALIELQSGRPAEAAQRAARAEQHCAGADCTWRPALLNVQASILLQEGNIPAAESRAKEALTVARGKDEREEASAWRNLAAATTRAGRLNESRKYWLAALEIDRRIGAPERTVLDLLGLARLELDAGDRAAARAYARRAAEMADGARLAAPATAARALLREAE